MSENGTERRQVVGEQEYLSELSTIVSDSSVLPCSPLHRDSLSLDSLQLTHSLGVDLSLMAHHIFFQSPDIIYPKSGSVPAI